MITYKYINHNFCSYDRLHAVTRITYNFHCLLLKEKLNREQLTTKKMYRCDFKI